MKNLIYIVFILVTVNSYAQIEPQKKYGIIYSSYPFNSKISKEECKTVSKLNSYIKKKRYKDLPIIVLNLHYGQVIDFKSGISRNNIELAYQTYKDEFLGGNGNSNSYDGEHVYIDISMERGHLDTLKRLIDYVVKNLESLKAKEASLKIKKETNMLSDEDMDSFKMNNSMF